MEGDSNISDHHHSVLCECFSSLHDTYRFFYNPGEEQEPQRLSKVATSRATWMEIQVTDSKIKRYLIKPKNIKMGVGYLVWLKCMSHSLTHKQQHKGVFPINSDLAGVLPTPCWWTKWKDDINAANSKENCFPPWCAMCMYYLSVCLSSIQSKPKEQKKHENDMHWAWSHL